MLKSQIIQALHHKHNNLSLDDIEQLFSMLGFVVRLFQIGNVGAGNSVG